jgi:uncharacterized protein (DUF697 family)
MAIQWLTWRRKTPLDERQLEKDVSRFRQTAPVPCLWLFGKTGSGKTSVIHYLTGAEEAIIGEGFRPQTKTSRCFDFPNSIDPLLRFLDTRGLAEATYDPTDDIQQFSQSTQMMIVTVRVTDHALSNLITPLRAIRRATPETPVLLVLTCLHEALGFIDLTEGPDPFQTTDDRTSVAKASRVEVEAVDVSGVPETLQRLISEKSSQFAGLFDAIIPIDLTRLEDGYANPEFGGERLKKAILEKLPHAYRQALLALKQTDGQELSKLQRKSRWQVLTSSALAATAGVVPLPWVDIPAVLGIQAHMATRIAAIYDQEITPARWALLSSAAGTRIAVQLVVREVLKFIPFVGMAVGAAGAFTFTYALGMSWDWYFATLQKGRVPSADDLKEVFAEQLQRGQALWRA